VSTLISWAHETMNFWMGCRKCAPECVHCYIPYGNGFGRRDPWDENGPHLTKDWRGPCSWQTRLGESDECARVFTCSLGDFFDQRVDARGWRDDAWTWIRNTPNLIWLILTKRPELIADRLPKDWPYQNVWLGVSTGCKSTLKKVDILRQIPMHERAVRFISAEPLLEDIADDLDLEGIGWLITGGESGHGDEYLYNPATWSQRVKRGDDSGRRTMRLEWAKNVMELARFHGVSFWFKQVTAPNAGVQPDALGQYYYEVPPPPFGTWATKSTRVTKETI